MSFKVKDFYFQKAKKENFLARSIYKLEEIDQKFHVIKQGDKILDLGYHPGSWVQYTSQKVGSSGLVTGIDIKEVNKQLLSLKNVKLFEKDIFSVNEIADLELDEKVDVLLSDMAPNTTGIKSVDQDRSLNLVEAVFEFMPKVLKPGGNFVIKVFDSAQAQTYLKSKKQFFKDFDFLKPKSTRSISKEFFVIGKQFKA